MSQQISYSELVSIILKQLNKFRQNPRSLVPLLDKRIDQYQDKYYLYGGNNTVKILTEEGVKPVKEVLNTLVGLDRLPKFAWSYELHCAANKRAHMLSKEQEHEKRDINLSTLDNLIPDTVEYSGEVSEHFVYGYCDPADIITNLLIDDGHPERQNRQSLLNRDLKHIGIGIEYHPKYMFVVVLIMVNKMGKKEDKPAHKPYHIFDEHKHSTMDRGSDQRVGNIGSSSMNGHQSSGSQNCQNCIIF